MRTVPRQAGHPSPRGLHPRPSSTSVSLRCGVTSPAWRGSAEPVPVPGEGCRARPRSAVHSKLCPSLRAAAE